MKKILKKIFYSRSPISIWLLIVLLFGVVIQLVTIIDMTETIRTEQYLRFCPEPYVCVIPPPKWSARPLKGLIIFKRIEV